MNSKKLIIVAISVMLVGCLMLSTAAFLLKGDVNLDYSITTSDARIVLMTALGSGTLSGDAFTNGDYDSNGTISTSDARSVLIDALSDVGLSLVSLPTKTTYYTGETLDLTGGYISSGNSGIKIVMSASMISGFSSATVGTKPLTVTYSGKTLSFNINVVRKTAEFSINGLFNHHMVLQHSASVPVFGLGTDGVTVNVSFGGQEKQTVISGGKWRVNLDSMPVSKVSQILTVTTSAGEKYSYGDVLVGDVWLCSGQSNMYWKVGYLKNSAADYQGIYANVASYNASIADANNSMIRSCWAEPVASSTPRNDIERQKWVVSTKTSIDDQSAYAMGFAQTIQPVLDIPIGIVTLSQGSTYISQWIEGGNYYNGVIKPAMPFRFKGLLWWQGETDCIKLADFKTSYPARYNQLISQWRAGFENPDMPIIQTQIVNYILGGDTGYGSWTEMQHMQPTMIDEARGLYTVCCFDTIDDLGNVHSTYKKLEGTRAGNLILEKIYDVDGAIGAAPRLLSAVKTSSGVMLTFTDVHGALTSAAGVSSQFTACGSNGRYVTVTYSIRSSNQILLYTNSISGLKTIRYLGTSWSTAQIYSSGIPAFGFTYNF